MLNPWYIIYPVIRTVKNMNFVNSISELLMQTIIQPLCVRKLKLMACEVYKIVNDLSPKYIQDLVHIKMASYDFRSERKADIPRVISTRYGLRSFRSEAVDSLPNNLRLAESYPQFRRLLQSWDGFACKCLICCT